MTQSQEMQYNCPAPIMAHALARLGALPGGNMVDLKDYMTTYEAALKLGIHVMYIRRLVKDGKKLAGFKVGNSWLISRKSVAAYSRRTRGMDKNDPRRGNR